MHMLEANARFALRGDHSLYPDGGLDEDWWPIFMVAAVELAHLLNDAETDDDLDQGVRHFLVLYEADVFSDDEWDARAGLVLSAIAACVDNGSMPAVAARVEEKLCHESNLRLW